MADYSTKMSMRKADEARFLYKSGWTVKKLCEKFGLSERSMYDLLKGRSWTTDKHVSVEAKERYSFYDQVIASCDKGLTTKQVAEDVGCSPAQVNAVKRYLKKAKDKTIGERDKELNSTLYHWAILRTLQWAKQNGLIKTPEEPLPREPITAEDWKDVALTLAAELRDLKADPRLTAKADKIKLADLLQYLNLERETIQIAFKDGKEAWDEAVELPANSRMLDNYRYYTIDEIEIVDSRFPMNCRGTIRVGISTSNEDEEEADDV